MKIIQLFIKRKKIITKVISLVLLCTLLWGGVIPNTLAAESVVDDTMVSSTTSENVDNNKEENTTEDISEEDRIAPDLSDDSTELEQTTVSTPEDMPAVTDEPEEPDVQYVPFSIQHQITIEYEDRHGNSLNPVGAPVSALVEDGTDYVMESVPNIVEHVYIGYQIDNGPLEEPSPITMPKVDNVTTDMTLVVLYGQDKGGPYEADGPDGVEDITIILKWSQDITTRTLKTSEEFYLNIGDDFTRVTEENLVNGDPAGGNPTLMNRYNLYKGYRIDNGPLLQGTPQFTAALAMDGMTIDFIYDDELPVATGWSAQLSGFVFEDVNGNGVYDVGIDTPLRNAPVKIAVTTMAQAAINPDTAVYDGLYGSPFLQDGITVAYTDSNGYYIATLSFDSGRRYLPNNSGSGGTAGNPPVASPSTSYWFATSTPKAWDNLYAEHTKFPEHPSNGFHMGSVNASCQMFAGEYDGYVMAGTVQPTIIVGGKALNSSFGGPIPNGDTRKADIPMIRTPKSTHTVTIKYQDRGGAPVPVPANAPRSAQVRPGDSYTLNAIPFAQYYTYIGFDIDGAGLNETTANPSISNITTDHIMTVVYGQDRKGPDGNEDISIYIQWLDEDSPTTKLRETELYYMNVGDTFDDTPDPIIVSNNKAYKYVGYRFDNDTATTITSNPLPPFEAKPDLHLVRYVKYMYREITTSSLRVEVRYKDRFGATVSPSEILTVNSGDSVSWESTSNPQIQIKLLNRLVFVDWFDGNYLATDTDKINLKNNTDPKLSNITQNRIITLVYGQDKGGTETDPDNPMNPDQPDGKEDITMKLNWLDESNPITHLKAAKNYYVNVGESFGRIGEAPLTVGSDTYDYVGYRLNSDNITVSGNPSFVATLAMHNNQTVKYMYQKRVLPVNYTITIEYKDKAGNTLVPEDIWSEEEYNTKKTDTIIMNWVLTPFRLMAAPPTTHTVSPGGSYTLSPVPQVTNMHYVGYRVDSGAMVSAPAKPSVTNVTANVLLTVIYEQTGSVPSGPGTGTTEKPANPTDEENITKISSDRQNNYKLFSKTTDTRVKSIATAKYQAAPKAPVGIPPKKSTATKPVKTATGDLWNPLLYSFIGMMAFTVLVILYQRKKGDNS